MTVSIQWDNPDHTIILQELSGEVTVEEYVQIAHVTHEMLIATPHTVHVIYDRTAVTTIPAQMSKVFHYLNRYVTPNTGLRVVVGAELVTRINYQLCKVVAPALAKDVAFAGTRREARQLICGSYNPPAHSQH